MIAEPRRSTADPHADVKARIRALRAMTVERGCTEAEALAAAGRAAELMARYDLDAEAVERPPIVSRDIQVAGPRTKHPWVTLWIWIGECCHVHVWLSQGEVSYFGFEPDVEIADYLHDVLSRHVDAARAAFRASAEYRRRRTRKTKALAVDAFLAGFIAALATKVRLVFEDRVRADAERRRKHDLLDAEAERRDIWLRTTRIKTRRHDRHAAYYAGAEAARGIDVHRPMDGHGEPLALPGKRP